MKNVSQLKDKIVSTITNMCKAYAHLNQYPNDFPIHELELADSDIKSIIHCIKQPEAAAAATEEQGDGC